MFLDHSLTHISGTSFSWPKAIYNTFLEHSPVTLLA
jgi:hypothetical protein